MRLCAFVSPCDIRQQSCAVREDFGDELVISPELLHALSHKDDFGAGLWSVLCQTRHRAGTRPFRNRQFCTQPLRVWSSCKATALEGSCVAEGLIRLLNSSQLRGA